MKGFLFKEVKQVNPPRYYLGSLEVEKLFCS